MINVFINYGCNVLTRIPPVYNNDIIITNVLSIEIINLLLKHYAFVKKKLQNV